MCKQEKQTPVDQPTHPALILLAARPAIFAQQGSVDAYWRRRNGKTYGPYYRLRYREDRYCRSLYLGLAGPLVDRVRHVLHTLQTPLRQRRVLLQLNRQVQKMLRIDRRHVNVQLCQFGLRLKGCEIRGWRTSPITTFAKLIPTPRSMLASMRTKPFRLPRPRQLRFVPKGPAAKWFRENRPNIPKLPQARLQAVLDFRRAKKSCKHETSPRPFLGRRE